MPSDGSKYVYKHGKNTVYTVNIFINSSCGEMARQEEIEKNDVKQNKRY